MLFALSQSIAIIHYRNIHFKVSVKLNFLLDILEDIHI